MNVTIVTTTINEPTKATRKFAKIALANDWKFIVVGDTKTPHELYQKMNGVIYLHPDYQESKYKQLSNSIGWKSIQRRNIGFVEAFHETNCDIIVTVDDDNIPYDNWGNEIYVGKPVIGNCFTPKENVFDPLSVTNHNYLWHRGYPIDIIDKRSNVKCNGHKLITPLVQADLWNGDPDIDAIARLTYKPDIEFNIELPFFSKKISPFNSQNTFLSREVISKYAVLPHIGRMDDIWGGYIMQHYFPQSVIYGYPTVYQDRNVQDLITNLEKEIIGYRNTYKLINDLPNYMNYLPDDTKKFLDIYFNSF
jgi:hypothetical protein